MELMKIAFMYYGTCINYTVRQVCRRKRRISRLIMHKKRKSFLILKKIM